MSLKHSCSIKPCFLLYANNDTCPHTNLDEISTVLGELKINLQLQVLSPLTCGAPGVSRTRSGSSRSSLSKEFSMSLRDRTGPHKSASSLDVSSRWLALASRASDTASEGTSLRMGPRFSSASISWTWTQMMSAGHGFHAGFLAKYMAFQPILLHRLVCCGSYRYFVCVAVLKVLLHYGGDCLLKVPLIQRGDHSLIHTVFLTKHKHEQVKCWPALHKIAFIFLTTVWMN